MAARAELPPTLASIDENLADCVRRQSIIEAANELLEVEGLEGLTIRAMLKRTGLARRAFYERFASKDDLVVAVFEQTLQEAADFVELATAEATDPVEQLRLIVLGLVLGTQPEVGGTGLRRMSAIVREHMRLAQTRPAELEKALRPLLGVIADRIDSGIRAGQLRVCDPALHATFIYNLVASIVHAELLTEESGEPAHYRRQRLADDIWEFCRNAIVAQNRG